MLDAISVPLDVGFDYLLSPLECTGVRGYGPKLLLWMALPLALVTLIYTAFLLVELAEYGRRHGDRHPRASLKHAARPSRPSSSLGDRTRQAVAGSARAAVAAARGLGSTVRGCVTGARRCLSSRAAVRAALDELRPLMRSALLKSTPLQLKLLFLLYPVVTNMCFEAWPCYELGEAGDEGRFMKVDVAIRCGSAEHRDVLLTAYVGVVLYAGGLIALNAGLLWMVRHAIRQGTPTELSTALVFLHGEYHPITCWWELVEMIRRFLLVGLFRIIMPGTARGGVGGLATPQMHPPLCLRPAPRRLTASSTGFPTRGRHGHAVDPSDAGRPPALCAADAGAPLPPFQRLVPRDGGDCLTLCRAVLLQPVQVDRARRPGH